MVEPADRDDPVAMPWERLLPLVGAVVARWHRTLLAEHGLTPTSAGLLAALDRQDGLAHRELAGRLDLTPATLTPVVDALERAGDITRARDPRDRRLVRLSVTDAGRARLRAATAEVAVALPSRLPVPSAEQAGPVRDYLASVLAALDDRFRR